MATQSQQAPRPQPGIMYGITHTLDNEPILRKPKSLRVGIGLPRGPAINFWIGRDGKWYCRIGKIEDGKLKFGTFTFESRQQAEDYYNEALQKNQIPECKYPQKIGYFTFTRQRILADKSVIMEPAWDVIEAHGPTPTEVDIVLLSDEPLDGAYQMWTKSELKCSGDGVTAERVLSMAGQRWREHVPPADEVALAEAARKDGLRHFPVISGCWTYGCPYSKEYTDNGKVQPSPCKPNGDLRFQLLNRICVGADAYFHTTGIRSIQYLHSSLEDIKNLTGGRLRGVPLKMVMRPFRSAHNGQAATHYSVSLEFRADNIEQLRKNLIEQAIQFQSMASLPAAALRLSAPPPAMISAPASDDPEDAAMGDEEDAGETAQAIAAEFYTGGADDGPEIPESQHQEPTQTAATPATGPSAQAKQATEQRTSDLASRMRRSRTTAAPTTTPQPAPAAAPPAPAPESPASVPPPPAAAKKSDDWF